MYKLQISNGDEPSYIKFENGDPDLNINPNLSMEIVLPEGASVEIKDGHVILKGVDRPVSWETRQ